MGPLGNDGLPVPTGIVRPVYEPGMAEPSGYWPPAPSGLARTHDYAWANEGYFGKDKVTYYSETNLYENYWGCNECSGLFMYPEIWSSGLPAGSQYGNVLNPHNVPDNSQFD
jgi:hypothetical protein